jgi:hypothetical protein
MEERDWKNEILYGKLKKFIEENIEKLKIAIRRDGVNSINIVDKEIGGKVKRIVARYWENEKIFGLDKFEDDEVGLEEILIEAENTFGKNHLDRVFPDVIGKVSLYSEGLKSLVLLPLKIEKEQSREVVELLPLLKIKIRVGKSFMWGLVDKNEYDKAKITSSYIPMTIIDQEEVPKEIMETARREGKKTLFIRPDTSEDIKILRKYSGNKKFRDKDQEASIDMLWYGVKIKNLVKTLTMEVETDGPPKVLIERVKDRKGKVDEDIYFVISIRKSLSKFIKSYTGEQEDEKAKGLGDLGRIIAMSIEGDIERMKEEAREREEKETNQDNITSLRTARLILERVSEILKSGGKNVESESHLRSDYCKYRLFPKPTKDYTPIIEEEKEGVTEGEEDVDVIKKLDNRCFNSGEGRKEIKIVGMGDESGKELLYVRSLTPKLAKAFGKFLLEEIVDREKEKSKSKRKNLKNLKLDDILEKEVREVNKLSLLLSGAVVSSLKKFPKDMDSTMNTMEDFYNRMLLALTTGAYIYNYEDGEIEKKGNMALDWKELVRSVLGAAMYLNTKEEIKIEIPTEKEKGMKIEKKIETEINDMILYLDSGIKGKVVKIKAPEW